MAGLTELLAGSNLIVIVGLLVFFFVVQGLGATWQAKRTLGTMKGLFGQGTLAVGLAGSVYKGKAYAFLVSDDQGSIVRAQLLKGWTVFARPRPVEALIGLDLSDLLAESPEIEGLSSKALQAFAMAARSLKQRLEERQEEAGTEAVDCTAISTQAPV